MKLKIYYNPFRLLFFIIAGLILILSTWGVNPNEVYLIEWRFEVISTTYLNFSIIFNNQRLLFSSVVFFISANVLLFSNRYMRAEKENHQFLIIIILFILSINFLIFIPNLIFLLLGWDGLGLVRFLLVIHYPTQKSLAAGYITVLTNRIGDVIIIISIPLLFTGVDWTPSIYHNPQTIFWASIFILIAGITKRAQLPFSSWLPAAIAAPTPISALVHSSTLVTAGIFLLYRFYPFLRLDPIFNKALLFFSALTILIAGICAIKENDLKKIIALSTLSQLGVIIFSLAINLPELAYFHLLSHATFKALLFIGAGNLILQTVHSQDIRQFGNIFYYQPLTITTIVLAKLALIGFPFIAGFFSKDLIIEICLFRRLNCFLFTVLILATILTLTYSLRFIFILFRRRRRHTPLLNYSNSDKNINLSLAIMRSYVIFRGAFINWTIIFPYLHPSLLQVFKFTVFTLLIIIIIRLFILINPRYYSINLTKSKNVFTTRIWYINFINSQLPLKIVLPLGKDLYQNIDSNWNEIIFGRGIKHFLNRLFIYQLNWQQIFITTNFLLTLVLILLII